MNAFAMPAVAWPALLDAASAPYRGAGRFAWHFARGKLGLDPVFRYLLRSGLIPPQARVLDIGCGQGLLASLLQRCAEFERSGRWPSGWAPAPAPARVTGIELMPRDVSRAQAALGDSAEFICGDMRHTPFPEADAIVILDVLHYIAIAEQNEVLARVRRALPAGGTLLLRIGDAASTRGFVISQWVDRIVTFVRGHRVVPQFGRTLAAWRAQLESLGFEVRSQPMSAGTPFANVLLVARVKGAA
ncbi:MAG TPA: class I SAM-dependent methyltransferase [Burkholderiaceae bacterium]|nr:class I SAM-dependent methyltransferase [Burkholderiaceae bacterium]